MVSDGDMMKSKRNIKRIADMADVFTVFGSNVSLASALNVGVSTVSEMKRRNNIPPTYWPRLIKAAEKLGRSDFTFERMVELSARRQRNGRPSSQPRHVEAAE